MAIEPSISRNVGRDVPSAPAKIGDEHWRAQSAACERGQAGRQQMLLMAMHDIGTAQMSQQRKRQRIVALTAHVPGISDHSQIELANAFAAVVRTESEQHSIDFIGHVAREFEGIAFAAAEDTAFTENCGSDVENSQGPGLG